MTSYSHKKIRSFTRNVTCFCCRGEPSPEDDLNFGSNYCASGELDIVLKPDYQCEHRTCEAFGLTISVSTAFTSLAHILRCLSVKNFYILENSAEVWKGPFRSGYDEPRAASQFTQLRFEICTVLNFLKLNAKILLQDDYISSSSVHILQQYMANLKSWSLSFGRISDIPVYILNVAIAEHQTSSACHSLFHLKADFWWFLIVVHHCLDSPKVHQHLSSDHKICLTNEVPLRDRFVGDLILFVLWDLVTLSSFKFEKLHISDYLKVSPFPCSCVKEFWFLVLHLVINRQRSDGDSLWMYLHYIFRDITADDSLSETHNDSKRCNFKPEYFECKKPVEFLLWILTGVSSIWKYNSKGRFEQNTKGLSNYYELQKLVNTILTEQEEKRSHDDSRLQYCLQVCLILSELWETNLDLLITFTDYFLKNLNSCNQSGKTGIEAHCFPKTTGHEWIEQIKDLVSRPGNWTYSDNCFQLYILLTCQQLRHVQNDKLVTYWRRVAGRTFLKLTRPRLHELTESGLHNLLTLLLSLSCITNSKDICNKLVAMSGMVSGCFTKRALVWRALFAMAHNYQQKNEDTYHLTKALADQFTETLQFFLKSEKDCSSRLSLQKLILLYLSEAQNIFDCTPNFSFSEHILIGEPFAILLPHCNTSELSSALFTVQQALIQFRNIREKISKTSTDFFQETDPIVLEKHKAFVNQIFQYILPFVETHAVTQTPPDSVANIAAGLALLAAEGFYSSRMKDVFYFMNKFALSKEVNTKIASIFLCHTIPESKIVESLKSEEQFKIFGVWLRSVASTVDECHQLNDLGRLVSKLPEISKRFPSIEKSLAQENGHVAALIHFFKYHSKLYICSKDVQEKFVLSNKFQEVLRPFIAEVKELMKGNSSSELLNHIFKLTGNLVYYCSLLLYTAGSSSSLLPSILDITVLPISFVKEKIVNQTVLSVCKEHLHLFLFGLVQHNFQTDAYISRKLRDLIVVYLPKFPAVSGKVCPLLNLQPSDLVTRENTDEFLLFFAKTVCDCYFSKKSVEQNSQINVPMAVTLVFEITKQASMETKIRISATLFPSVLDLLFLAQDKNLSSQIEVLLSALISFSSQSRDLKTSQIQMLEAFVEQHLPWQSRLVFLLLERLASMKNTLVPDFLPFLTRMVETVEEKRGIGLDKSLRQGLLNVTRRLETRK